jgi:hypothetical protein
MIEIWRSLRAALLEIWNAPPMFDPRYMDIGAPLCDETGCSWERARDLRSKQSHLTALEGEESHERV